MVGNLENLRPQYQWAGLQLINTGVMVWDDELDVPQRQLGALIIPPDPVPVFNARPEEAMLIDETVYRFEQDGTQRVTMDGVKRVEMNKQADITS